MSSDRTQTHVERCAGFLLESVQEGPDGNLTISRYTRDQLARALSQPEHQGDEKAERIVARIVSRWLINRGAEIRAGQALTGTPNGIAREILAALPAQLPAPVLSDEERERLETIAASIDDLSGVPPWPDDGEFLRNLASQEHRGRIAELEALEPGWDSYDGKVPTAEALERLRGFDRALAYVPIGDGGVQVEFHALGLDFEVVIDPAGQVTEHSLESQEHRGEETERIARAVKRPSVAWPDGRHGPKVLYVCTDRECGNTSVGCPPAACRDKHISKKVLVVPEPPAGEGDDCERCKGSGVELRQGCGEWISDPCPDCDGTGKRQPEGGDEEDWPAAVREAKAALADFDSHGDYEAPIASLRQIVQKLSALPAAVPSDPSVLELATELAEARDEANKAEAEAASQRALLEEVRRDYLNFQEEVACREKAAKLKEGES